MIPSSASPPQSQLWHCGHLRCLPVGEVPSPDRAPASAPRRLLWEENTVFLRAANERQARRRYRAFVILQQWSLLAAQGQLSRFLVHSFFAPILRMPSLLAPKLAFKRRDF